MLSGRILLVLKVFLQCDAYSHGSCELDLVHDICTGIGCEVFFDCFLPIHPIPTTRPVIVAASRIDFTSLLSDIVCIYKIFEIIHLRSHLHSHLRCHRHSHYCTPQSPLL